MSLGHSNAHSGRDMFPDKVNGLLRRKLKAKPLISGEYLNPDIVWQRAGAGTCVDASGNVVWGPHNLIEKSTTVFPSTNTASGVTFTLVATHAYNGGELHEYTFSGAVEQWGETVFDINIPGGAFLTASWDVRILEASGCGVFSSFYQWGSQNSFVDYSPLPVGYSGRYSKRSSIPDATNLRLRLHFTANNGTQISGRFMVGLPNLNHGSSNEFTQFGDTPYYPPRKTYLSNGEVGYLIEAAHTNLLRGVLSRGWQYSDVDPQSSIAATGEQSALGTHAIFTPGITGNTVASDSNDGYQQNRAWDLSGVAAGTYTASMYVKNAVAGVGGKFALNATEYNSDVLLGQTIIDTSDTFKRVAVTYTCTSANPRFAFKTQQAVIIAGLQLETGSAALSYVPTYSSTATATCAADIVSVTSALSGIKDAEGALLARAQAGMGTGSGMLVAGVAEPMSLQSYRRLSSWDGSMLSQDSSADFFTSVNTGITSWKTGGNKTALSKGPEGVSTYGGSFCGPTLQIGNFSGTSNFLNGTITQLWSIPAQPITADRAKAALLWG